MYMIAAHKRQARFMNISQIGATDPRIVRGY